MKARLQPLMRHTTDEHRTPKALFDFLQSVYGPFTCDAAATKDNALCNFYFTKNDDALKHRWTGCVYINPPYGRGIAAWCKYAYEQVHVGGSTAVVCMLLPARTDTVWFHDYVLPYAQEVWWVRGRVKFGDAKQGAPFPSMVVVWRRAPLQIPLRVTGEGACVATSSQAGSQ